MISLEGNLGVPLKIMARPCNKHSRKTTHSLVVCEGSVASGLVRLSPFFVNCLLIICFLH